jgi:uncharacterized linocin/CFP29 family protein
MSSVLSKHPLEIPPGKKLTREELLDALRLSIIAELDAVSLYLQIARATDDEKARKVFEEVAREEKTHVGEFLALLKSYDPQQAEELAKGAREVEELTGLRAPNSASEKPAAQGVEAAFEKLVESEVKKLVDESRVLVKKLPVLHVGRGVEAVPVEVVREGSVERTIAPLCEVSAVFRVSQRALDYYLREKKQAELAEAYYAAAQLALGEEKMVAEALLSGAGVKLPMGSWDEPGQSVQDIARAVSELLKNGARKPLVLLLSPARYAKLLAVSEKTGVTDLERIKALVDEVVYASTIPDDKAVLLSATRDVLDVVYGGNAEVDYIGPEDGFHKFRVWSTLAVRLRDPRRVALLSATSTQQTPQAK